MPRIRLARLIRGPVQQVIKRPQVLTQGNPPKVQRAPFDGMIGRTERELVGPKYVAFLLETLFNSPVLSEKRWIEAEADKLSSHPKNSQHGAKD